MSRAVRTFTALDAEALELIRQCGFVSIDRGQPCLESNRQIGKGRFRRLIEHRVLVPSQDSFLGGVSQTYRPLK